MDSHTDTTAPMLSATEARILGSLVEKAATTPDVYPLTLNNVVLACNQKTAREPTMNLGAGDVGHALRQMEPRGLVKSEYGARSERYYHRIDRVLDLTPAQTCLMALLMLRGPQTLYELLTRSERMHKFGGVDDVHHALERLAERDKPLVRKLARGGGQREDRYARRTDPNRIDRTCARPRACARRRRSDPGAGSAHRSARSPIGRFGVETRAGGIGSSHRLAIPDAMKG
jgi:uncharacterized protein